MDWHNLTYAVVQVVHNFGAVAVVGAAVGALWRGAHAARRPLAWTVLAGWAAQAASGAAFGAASWLFYGQFPDLHGLAVAALLLKMGCAAAGCVLAAWLLYRGAHWALPVQQAAWRALVLLAVTALTAAAFLRWFS